MKVEKQIKELGCLLKSRLDPELVDYALDYIEHSETVLAFETLCDHIADYDVQLSKEEYEQILSIVNSLNLELSNRYQYINPNK